MTSWREHLTQAEADRLKQITSERTTLNRERDGITRRAMDRLDAAKRNQRKAKDRHAIDERWKEILGAAR